MALATKPGARGSVLQNLRMSGSFKVLFPRPNGPALQAVFLNTAGGVTGGDDFAAEMTVGADTQLVVTTQAAERIYRAMPDSTGQVHTVAHVGAGGSLTWVPQETILFDGAALNRSLRVQADPGARVLLSETLVFGRAAMGERVMQLDLRDSIDLTVDGALVFADRLRLGTGAQGLLLRQGVADGHAALASVVLYAPGAAAQLEVLGPLLPATAGASALSDDLIFLRILAEDSFVLRQSLMPVLAALSAADLPRPWMI